MASKLEFVQYAADQLSGAGEIRFQKMFGDYGLYCNWKIFALICDNQLFIKVTDAGRKLAPQLQLVSPYEGAKPYFLIEDIDDREFLTRFASATCTVLPEPKPKKGEKVMPFDYKKEYKEFYLPPKKPGLVQIPEMNFIAVPGKGDPNESDGEYKAAMSLLYGIAFTIKMSYMGTHRIEGYFPYVVPPLEGFWWMEGAKGIDISHKEDFHWLSVIRLPEFVSKEEFDWAVREATEKKKTDFSKARFFTCEEGLCVQCMHIGSYDHEPVTIAAMEAFAEEQGYALDFSDTRLHHEIYLSDPRRTAEDRLKTVIRLPVKKL